MSRLHHLGMINRMQFSLSPALLCLVFVSIVLSQDPLFGQEKKAGASQVTAQKVRGNLYQTSGGVGNAFIYAAEDECIVIDATMSESSCKQMLEESKRLSGKPLRRVLLTHSDGDHVNGLSAMPQGVSIFSHQNTRREIEKANMTAKVKLPLPNVTFAQSLTLWSGNSEIRLLYFGPAHTDGDVIVYFPAEKMAIVGDLLFIGRDPLIHRQKNGSSIGLIKVLQSLIQLDADLYLSGHAAPVGKTEIQALIDRLEKSRNTVKEMVDAGKTIDEVKKAFGVTADAPQRWPHISEIIYRELTGNK